MTDQNDVPGAGHNFSHITKLADEMRHHAGLWSANAERGERHRREVMVRAYQLCLWGDDPAQRILVAGLLSEADIPKTKRSERWTQALHYAFQEAKCKPEPSQLSRWAWSICHALNQSPRPQPEQLLDFIKREGGEVKSREKARKAAAQRVKAEQDASDTGEPKPILLPCSLPNELDGKRVQVKKTETGWQVIPPKGVSLDTTQSLPPQAAG